jgi:hypothetical protein
MVSVDGIWLCLCPCPCLSLLSFPSVLVCWPLLSILSFQVEPDGGGEGSSSEVSPWMRVGVLPAMLSTCPGLLYALWACCGMHIKESFLEVR